MSRSPAPIDGPTVPQRPLSPLGDSGWVDRVIGGKYAVEGILGRGGMGLVLKARHLRLDEPVAIKVLHKSLLHDPSMAARMLREARAALRLSSEHVVRVMDVDTLENGVPYMVLEYLEGTDLATLAKKRTSPMPWEHVVAIMEQACRALAEAHAIGVIHRDFKPANLFIVKRPDGRRVVKLLDFGVSKIDLPREAPITKQGDILGSPRYMAPEQVKGDTLDGRSDIWSVGVVLYELLTGTAPFAAPNFAVACRLVLEETPPSLATLRPDVPAGLVAVVEKCLEKDRNRRFSDALALRDALAPFGVLSQRTGSQLTLPDIGELLSSDVPVAPVGALTPSLAPPSGGSLAPPSGGSIAPLSGGSIAPPSGGSIAPPSGAAITDPSSASLATDVRPSYAATSIGARVRSRRLRWIAIAALSLGLLIGITLLVRGRVPEAGPQAAQDKPQPPSSVTAPPVVSPANVAPTSPTPSSSASTTPSAAATEAPSASASASSSTDAKGAMKGSHPAGATTFTKPATDPFGERRQ